MWEGGPTRKWSATKCPGVLGAYYGGCGGFVGSYVCQTCGHDVGRVYCVDKSDPALRKWICDGCKDNRHEK
jgi:hypothetical protein